MSLTQHVHILGATPLLFLFVLLRICDAQFGVRKYVSSLFRATRPGSCTLFSKWEARKRYNHYRINNHCVAYSLLLLCYIPQVFPLSRFGQFPSSPCQQLIIRHSVYKLLLYKSIIILKQRIFLCQCQLYTWGEYRGKRTVQTAHFLQNLCILSLLTCHPYAVSVGIWALCFLYRDSHFPPLLSQAIK
jgi:hypothetical protein